MKAQVAARPIGALLGLQATFSPFARNPAYAEWPTCRSTSAWPRCGDPAVRARILAAESPDGRRAGFDDLYLLGDPPDYEQPPERSIGGRAQDREPGPGRAGLRR